MRKTMKVLAIIGAVALALGLILCAGAMAASDGGVRDGLHWLTLPAYWTRGSDGQVQFNVGESQAPVTLTYTAQGPVNALTLGITSHDVQLVPSDSLSTLRITYDQTRDDQFTIREENGALTFKEQGQATVGFNFGFNVKNTRVLVEYPAAQTFESLTVICVSGDVDSKVPAAGKVVIGTTSGDVRTDALTAESLEVTTISGEQRLGPVSAGTIELASTSGDIRFDALDGDTVSATSVSGSVKGSIRCRELKAGTTSGDVALKLDSEKSTVGTISGEVELKLAPAAYRTELSTASGDARIGNRSYDNDEFPFKGRFTLEANGEVTSGTPEGARTLSVTTTSGEVSLKID